MDNRYGLSFIDDHDDVDDVGVVVVCFFIVSQISAYLNHFRCYAFISLEKCER